MHEAKIGVFLYFVQAPTKVVEQFIRFQASKNRGQCISLVVPDPASTWAWWLLVELAQLCYLGSEIEEKYNLT